MVVLQLLKLLQRQLLRRVAVRLVLRQVKRRSSIRQVKPKLEELTRLPQSSPCRWSSSSVQSSSSSSTDSSRSDPFPLPVVETSRDLARRTMTSSPACEADAKLTETRCRLGYECRCEVAWWSSKAELETGHRVKGSLGQGSQVIRSLSLSVNGAGILAGRVKVSV